MLGCVARRCSSLKKLSVHAVKPKADYFKSIVYKNKSLKCIVVEFQYDGDDDDDDDDGSGGPFYNTSEIISVFLRSPNLEEVEFSDPGGSFLEPHSHLRQELFERGVQISFHSVDFLRITGSWTERFQEFVEPIDTEETQDLSYGNGDGSSNAVLPVVMERARKFEGL